MNKGRTMLTAASTDYIQATIEIFGAVITIIIGIMLFVITGNKKKSEKNLFALIMLAGFSLVVDAGWYIFDGNVRSYAVTLNYICNMAIFIINPLMVLALRGYLDQIIIENQGKKNKPITYTIYGLAAVSIGIVISNIFVKWMYEIDAKNIYHRLDGWFIYSALNCIAIALIIITALINFKVLPSKLRIGFFIFLLAPFVGIALQTVVMGISFIQMGIAVGCVAILINYVIEMLANENDKNGITEERKNFLLIECILMVMVLCISAAVISCIVSVNMVSNQSSEQSSKALTYMVSDVVNSHISEPVNASRTMAQSQIIIDALSSSDLQDSAVEERMISYLQRIKREYGFQTIFVASDSTHAYYTSDGFSRIMDISRDSQDAWYGNFRNRNVEYSLNVDEDKDNDLTLCVFVNVAVRDDDGNFLGVCGTAMSIESFLEIIAGYEKSYNIDISLMNRDGLVQIDSDRNLIENSYINVPTYQPSTSSNTIYYERNSLQAVMSKYMSDLNWYLIVADNQPDKMDVFQIVLPAITIFVIGISLLLLFIIMFNKHNDKNINKLKSTQRLSETDGLTGLLNRYALEEYEEEITKSSIPMPLSVVMLDVNGLKTVNDTLGHEAGDELIKGAADCMLKSFASSGEIYRFGGDEFLAVLHTDENKAKSIVDLFDKRVESWHGKLVNELSISTGIASTDSNPKMSFDELKNEADKLMYQDKTEYYKRTGKIRR